MIARPSPTSSRKRWGVVQERVARRRLDVSEPFARPVAGVPAYGAIVARPMDLGTIGARLADGAYHADGAAAFAADVRLVHANAAVF